MGVFPADISDGGGGKTGGGDILLPPPEKICTVNFGQDHYVRVSGDGEASRIKGGQLVVGSGRLGIGRDADGGLRGETGGGGEGEGRDGDRDRQLIRWEDTVANVILGMEPNAPLAYATGLELHHPIMSMLGGHGGRLDIYIYTNYDKCAG